MSRINFSKRRFLFGAGGAALALPFLHSLMPRQNANASPLPRRFISIFSANGQHDGNWYPSAAVEFAEVGKSIREAPLTSIHGPLSTVLGTEFDAFREKMILIRGLDAAVLNENTHIATKMLSGYGEASPLRATVDQIMSRSSAVYDREPWMRSLNVVVDGQSEMKHLPLSVANSAGAISPIVPYADPAILFQKMFPTPISHDVRKSVIDSVGEEMNSLIKSPQLSVDDRHKLDAHLSFLRDVEKQSSPENSCARPQLAATNRLDERDAASVLKNFSSLMFAGLRCDLCRVFNLQLAQTQDQRSFSWLTGVTSNHHNLTHSAGATEVLAKINRWYSVLVAQFLQRLEEVEDTETGATYLDNSLVFWGNESGVYNLDFGNPHYSNDMQVLLIGGAGGRLKTNRYIDYQQSNKKVIMWPDGREDKNGPNLGRPYNEFLIALMNKMGLSHTEWESGNEPGFGDYRVNFKNQYDFGDRRTPLPMI
jgi:hypothetical protein